jgi:hypothetical protein
MSQRLGMADGRWFTLNSSAQLTNNYIMQQNGIAFEDNYSYRQLLQKSGPELISKLAEQSRTTCDPCDRYTDISKTY